MKRLVLLVVSALFLVACAQPRYAWEHYTGLGVMELQQDYAVCNFYAENLILPTDYNTYPFEADGNYGGYPFYGEDSPIEHPDHYVFWHRQFYLQGFNTYAYTPDISLACLNGKGWTRIKVEEGQILSAPQILLPEDFDVDDVEIKRKDSPLEDVVVF